MKIDKEIAAKIFREEANDIANKKLDAKWVTKMKIFSDLCIDGGSKTHIAFLGTSILAKLVNLKVDLYAIKPGHEKNNKYSYSARTLCHSVLVPLAAEYGINIGVTGREPLNNQPYFRMTRLDDGTPLHQASKPAFSYMLSLISELSELNTEKSIRLVLSAYISVRQGYKTSYVSNVNDVSLSADQLPKAIEELVKNNSEKGRRAQAVVAGLLDVVFGSDFVESGRINDPSRKYPGDVCVRSKLDSSLFIKAMEVRDKPVSLTDIQIFGKKCIEMNLREAAIVMASDKQSEINMVELDKWSDKFGIPVTVFKGWSLLVQQVLLWSSDTQRESVAKAVKSIEARLISVEASAESVELWQKLTRK